MDLNGRPEAGVYTGMKVKNCDSIRLLLALNAGDDLDPLDREPVEGHLKLCRACREEAAQFRAIIDSVQKSYIQRYELSPIERNRIAIAAAERARRGGWIQRLPLLLAPSRGTGLMAAAALLVALVAVPIGYRNGGGAPAPGAKTMTIEVITVEPGVVRLAWSNGARDGYTVYKSHDPRRLSHAEAHEVVGTIWTDTDSESSPIVYYRIE